jgi:hypothetical protein
MAAKLKQALRNMKAERGEGQKGQKTRAGRLLKPRFSTRIADPLETMLSPIWQQSAKMHGMQRVARQRSLPEITASPPLTPAIIFREQ